MPWRSTTQTPATESTRLLGGPVLFWIGVAVFLASMAAGLARSYLAWHWIPRVGVEYTTELDAIIQERGRVDALPQIRSAARIDFDNDKAVALLLDSAREAGDRDDVIWALVALARLKPEDGKIRNELTAALLDQGRYAEAYTQGRFAIFLTPDSPESFCNLGAALMQLGQPAQAAVAYRRALEIDPNYQTARRVLASTLQGY